MPDKLTSYSEQATRTSGRFSRLRFNTETQEIRLDPLTSRLVGIAIALYCVELLVAILFHRHLFGDAAWFLVRVLSENQVTNWYTEFRSEFFRSRWFSFHFTQWPMLWASRLGVTNLAELSWLFGIGLFLHRPLSLLACWLWLRDKRLYVFPLASLFAGSINAELYIVSETHFILSLVWPLLVLLWSADLTPPRRRVWLVLIAIPSLLAYETMVFFGPLLAVAAGVRVKTHWQRRSERFLFLALLTYFALGSIFAALAIVWPRDALNRGTFVSGIVVALERGHLGIVASVLLVLTFPLVAYLWPRQRRASTILLIVPLLFGALYVANMYLAPERLDFETHGYARGMSALTPWPLCLMFCVQPLLPWIRRQGLIPCLRATAVLGMLQCFWAVGATVFWANMVTVLRMELARTEGVISYDSTVLARPAFRGMPMRSLHIVWPLLPLSVVLGGSLEVSSVVFADQYPFAPFDPFVPAEFPNLSRFGVDYTRLRAALDTGHLDFRPGKNGRPFLREGWWKEPDDWAHWTDGPRATIRLPKPPGIQTGGILRMKLGAFVCRDHPRQRMTASLNGQRLGVIEFNEALVAGGPASISLPIPAEAVSQRDQLVLELDLPDARSPSSLGLSDDFRRLGIALVELWLAPNR